MTNTIPNISTAADVAARISKTTDDFNKVTAIKVNLAALQAKINAKKTPSAPVAVPTIPVVPK